MNNESNQGTGRSERESRPNRSPPNNFAAAGIAGAIILLIVIIIVSVMGHI